MRLVMDDDKARLEEALRILYEYGDDFVARRSRALIIQVLSNMSALEKPAPTGVLQSSGDSSRVDALLPGDAKVSDLHAGEGETPAAVP